MEIIERPNPQLGQYEHSRWNDHSQQGGKPDGYNVGLSVIADRLGSLTQEYVKRCIGLRTWLIKFPMSYCFIRIDSDAS
jgi:hypothetical protein